MIVVIVVVIVVNSERVFFAQTTEGKSAEDSKGEFAFSSWVCSRRDVMMDLAMSSKLGENKHIPPRWDAFYRPN